MSDDNFEKELEQMISSTIVDISTKNFDSRDKYQRLVDIGYYIGSNYDKLDIDKASKGYQLICKISEIIDERDLYPEIQQGV